MTTSDRRQFLKSVLVTLAQAGGTVVLATATPTQGQTAEPAQDISDIQNRADELVAFHGASEIQGLATGFVNRAFRNGFGGGFRNGGFRNAGIGGGFRNGGFGNGFGGAFRNGAFRNW